MTFSLTRMGAVVRKEVREYRRNGFIVATMVALPLLFLIIPTADLFRNAAPALLRAQVGTSLLLLLVTPVLIPATLAAYSVVGEREQGTLEPVLTTPVTREELLLGKGVAAMLPAVAIAYLLFTIVVVAVRFGANQAVVSDVWQAPNFLAQALFAPLLAGWSIWVGTAISVRSSDVRVAQQLGTLGSLPPLGIVALMTPRHRAEHHAGHRAGGGAGRHRRPRVALRRRSRRPRAADHRPQVPWLMARRSTYSTSPPARDHPVP